MSNILKTSEDLKKKLSLSDIKLSSQQESTPERNHAEQLPRHQNAELAKQHESKSSSNLNSVQASHQGDKELSERDSKSESYYTSEISNQQKNKSLRNKNNEQVHQHNSKPVKVMHYLSYEVNKMLMSIYINRLQNDQKSTKSEIISEAIRLLHKREM